MADNNNSNLFSVPEVNEIKRLAGGGITNVSDSVTLTIGSVVLSSSVFDESSRIAYIYITTPILIPSNAIDVFAFVNLETAVSGAPKSIILCSPCTVSENKAVSTLGRHILPEGTYTVKSGGLKYRTIS